MQRRLVMIGGTNPIGPTNRLKWDSCFTPESRHRSVCAADCNGIVCYGAAKLADEHLVSTIHCVDDETIGWLKRREQASFNRFGESAKIAAALRRGPAR